MMPQNQSFREIGVHTLYLLTKGMGTDNLRIHIDAAWIKRCRMMKFPR